MQQSVGVAAFGESEQKGEEKVVVAAAVAGAKPSEAAGIAVSDATATGETARAREVKSTVKKAVKGKGKGADENEGKKQG